MSNSKFNFSESMKRIDAINEWFQGEDLDLEEALTKLKEGKELIQKCKQRLVDIENEFKELKADFVEEESPSSKGIANDLDELSNDIPF